MKLLSHLALMAGLLLLAGCAGTPGTHVWWNPATWGTDRAAAVAKIEVKQEANNAQLNVAALREVFKTTVALKAAPAEDRAVQTAQRTADNAYSLLSLANGALDLGAMQQDRETIAKLLSDNIALRAEGEKAQTKAEGAQAKLSRENEDLRAANEAAAKKLAVSYVNERKLANTVRNFWWIGGCLLALWLLGNLLGVAARFVPALAPVSHVVNSVAAPALAFAASRAEAGLQKVGQGLAAMRDRLPEILEEIKGAPDAVAKLDDKITRTIDSKLDADHQLAIGAAANTAPRT